MGLGHVGVEVDGEEREGRNGEEEGGDVRDQVVAGDVLLGPFRLWFGGSGGCGLFFLLVGW